MRLIDADKLFPKGIVIVYDDNGLKTAEGILEKIYNAPTVETVPVVHAKWIAQDNRFTRFMCSQCEAKNYEGHQKFCPNCGAKMDGKNVD